MTVMVTNISHHTAVGLAVAGLVFHAIAAVVKIWLLVTIIERETRARKFLTAIKLTKATRENLGSAPAIERVRAMYRDIPIEVFRDGAIHYADTYDAFTMAYPEGFNVSTAIDNRLLKLDILLAEHHASTADELAVFWTMVHSYDITFALLYGNSDMLGWKVLYGGGVAQPGDTATAAE